MKRPVASNDADLFLRPLCEAITYMAMFARMCCYGTRAYGIRHLRMRFTILILLCGVSAPAAAEPVLFLPAGAAAIGSNGSLIVNLVGLNSDNRPVTLSSKAPLEGTFRINGVDHSVRLENSGDVATIPAGGFVQLRYVLRPSTQLPVEGVGELTVPALGLIRVGLSFVSSSADSELADRPIIPSENEDATPSAGDAIPSALATVTRGNAFLGNLSAYRPIYAVYGPGTNTDARLQISFQYQPFGDPTSPPDERGPLDNLRFAYTQRMFWDLGAKSSPFRNVDYMPELFYLLPERRLSSGFLLGAQAGFMHQSNGRSGEASRSLNVLYIQPMATFTTGRYLISAGPRGWIYVGSLSDNPDVKRYRGNFGLNANIDRNDGLRLSVSSRMSAQSGRASMDAELSYALDSLLGGGPKLYLFGQAFAGWGENLLDYRVRQTRLRIGIGIVR